MANVEREQQPKDDNIDDRPNDETGSLSNLANLQENFNQQQVTSMQNKIEIFISGFDFNSFI